MQNSHVYFNENMDSGRFVPRGMMIDLEPGVLDAIKASPQMGSFFSPDSYQHGQNGAGNNYAAGFYSEGAEIIDQVLDGIRHEAENCDML